MKVIVEINVDNCLNCPFKKEHRGHGECWTYCSHPDKTVKPYEDILWGCQESFTKTPTWCPIFMKVENET